ncbi:MAG: c(7)-type cytochrome triheme domain-containing protein [Nitrospinota bacterium]
MFPKCKNCHDKLFNMKVGSSDAMALLTMSNMTRGQFCGKCHNGEDATALTEDCEMCHVKKG